MTTLEALTYDSKTFLFCMGIFGLLMAAMSYSTAQTIRGNIFGLRDWSKGMLFMGISFFLFHLRGIAPDILTYFLANAVILITPPYLVRAYSKFFNVVVPKRWLQTFVIPPLICIWGIYLLELPYHYLIPVVCIPTAIVGLRGTWIVLRNAPLKELHAAWVSAAGTGLFSLALMARSIKSFFDADSVALTTSSGMQFGFLVASSLVIVGASLGFILMVHHKHKKDILDSSRRDGLTGLYTRSAFYEGAIEVTANAEAETYSVVMIDIDHFKKINDTYGHAVGDVAIIQAARLIGKSVRSIDLAGRYGGEEFCILLRGCKEEEAAIFANRLVEEARNQSVRLPNGTEIKFTVSAGYVCCPSDKNKVGIDHIKALLDNADQALYQAKHSGRNQAKPGTLSS